VKIAELFERWLQAVPQRKTRESYSVRLSIEDAARVHALAELFPSRNAEELITDLLGAALHEVEAVMPYRPGPKVISRDEQGDPIYEDVGLTPRFEVLVRKYVEQLAGNQ
jgi:hypothetical protein